MLTELTMQLLVFQAILSFGIWKVAPVLSSSCDGGVGCAEDSRGDQRLELKQVSIVMRHGARTPIDIFRTDPNKVEDWPSKPGTLTNQGLQQHYLLGDFLRRRYVEETKFLNPCYDITEIYVRSTDYDRTIRSALANMAGLYPPCNSSTRWHPTLDWTPVAIHSRSRESDTLMTYWNNCPRLMRCIDEIFEVAEDVLVFEKENERLIQFVREQSGWQGDFRSMWKIGDCLKSERENNMTWASWANETIYDLLINIEILNFKVYSYNDTIKRYTAGNMLKEIQTNMQKMLKGETVEKMRIYSGHDTSIISLMAVLGIWKFTKVNYASYLAFELYYVKETGKNYVKISLRDDADFANPHPIPQPLPVCGDESLCPLDDFQAFVDKFYIQDWEAECSLEEMPAHRIERLEETVTALTIVLAILIILVICFAGWLLAWLAKWKRGIALQNDSSQMTLRT